jgi:hypothetical protein
MKTIPVLSLGVAVAAAALLLSMPHASAQPVAGAYYSGQISGCADPPCGTVGFGVSEDGSQVEDFTAYNVPGDVCRFQGPQYYPTVLPIVEDAFGPGIAGMYEVSGWFPSEGSAQGTLRLALGQPKPCDTGPLGWTADTAPWSVGGIAELPDVSGSSAGHYLALAGVAAAALVGLVTSALCARRRWLS